MQTEKTPRTAVESSDARASDADTDVAVNSPIASGSLRFEVTRFDPAREGYLTLQWNRLPAAELYILTDQNDVEFFRGATSRAFVSGLRDGQYSFHIAALDGQGQTVAQSQTPAVVTVQHWSLTLALSLFACGFMVLLAITGVLVSGAVADRRRTRASTDGEAA